MQPLHLNTPFPSSFCSDCTILRRISPQATGHRAKSPLPFTMFVLLWTLYSRFCCKYPTIFFTFYYSPLIARRTLTTLCKAKRYGSKSWEEIRPCDLSKSHACLSSNHGSLSPIWSRRNFVGIASYIPWPDFSWMGWGGDIWSTILSSKPKTCWDVPAGLPPRCAHYKAQYPWVAIILIGTPTTL